MFKFLKYSEEANPGKKRKIDDSKKASNTKSCSGTSGSSGSTKTFTFNKKWTTNRPWLKYDSSTKLMFCTLCVKFKDPFVSFYLDMGIKSRFEKNILPFRKMSCGEGQNDRTFSFIIFKMSCQTLTTFVGTATLKQTTKHCRGKLDYCQATKHRLQRKL